MEPGLEETTFYDPENFVFPFGAHACVVDVDAETGKVDVVRYVAVDDCGPAINPMLIDGQVHGGIAHAIGQALYERIHYDEDGQLVTGTFVDYALPSAADVPSFETDRTETPSPVNSLGVKGVGEAGTIAASAAVANAVIDALRAARASTRQHANMPLDVRHARSWDERDPGRPTTPEGGGVIPAEFDYVAPDVARRGARRAARRRRGRQAARRRPLAAPADEAAAGGADAARRPAQGARAARRPARRTATSRIGAMTTPPRRSRRGDLGLASRGGGARSPTSRSATAARSAARWPTATRPPTCRRSCSPARAR